MHLAPPARPWLKRLVALNESVITDFLKCHIDVKRCPSGSQAASKMDCFFTSACASSAQVQRDGRARKEVDACRFRACAVLSDIVTDGIKTQLAQIWSQKEMGGCVCTWVLEKLAKPNVKSHSLLSVIGHLGII